MLAEVFREILKYAGLTRQNPEGGDHSELKQPGEAGRHKQESLCHSRGMDENFAHKIRAILIMHSNLKKCLPLPFVPTLSSHF